MFIRLNKRKAQSTLEYGVVIAVVVAALVAMQAYVKRGLQGKIKESTDQIGEQYSPEHASGTVATTVTTETTENVTIDSQGRPVTLTNSSQNQDQQTQNTVGALSQENW